MMKNKRMLVAMSVLAGIVIIGSVYGILQKGEKKAPPVMEEQTEEQTENSDDKESSSVKKEIAVPGADVMNVKANQKKQMVSLYNPERNSCYFKISLLLENGTLLYQSDLIAPGEEVDEIELSKALPEGTYGNSILKYECFDMDKDHTPLNGTEFVFTIQSNP